MAGSRSFLPTKEMLQKDVTLMKRMLALVLPYWRRLLVAMLLMMIMAACGGATAYMLQPVVDDVFIGKNMTQYYVLPMVVLVLFVVKGGCAYGQSYLMQWVGERIITQYRIMLYSHIQKLSLSYFDKSSTGELMSRITNDVTRVQGSVTFVATSMVRDTCQLVVLAGVMIYMDWFLAVIALLIFPLCMLPLVKLGRMLRKVTTRSQESMGRINVSLHETIGGVRIVKGFCREEYEGERFGHEAFTQFKLRVKDVAIRAITSPLMETFGGLGIVAILYYGGWQVLNDQRTMGEFSAFLASTLLLYDPVRKLSNLWNELQSGLSAATRIYEVLDTPVEVVEKPDQITTPPPVRDKIEYRDVSFAYEAGKPVLSNVNLVVPVGSILALVGNSGGGKTTMVNLLPRFYDVSAGAILIDGQDIRNYSLHALRSQIAIVTQQTFLFNDTVRANISYARPEATEMEVVAAAQAAYAWDFIQKLPKGLDSIIGEAGVLLSGGERQRLSIARALLSNRPILILDEATSSLDTQSEMYVQKALENLMQGRTTFVIAHRLSTIRKADHIIVMSEGKIMERGGHETLLAQGNLYKSLHDMQFQLDEGMDMASERGVS